MRLTILLLSIFSCHIYAGMHMTGTAGAPCIGGIDHWEPFEYILCPTAATVSIPLTIIVAPTGATMYAASSTDKKEKLIINNKIHAASYVASDGKIGSAYLEQILIILRKEYPNTTDMELAKAILAY